VTERGKKNGREKRTGGGGQKTPNRSVKERENSQDPLQETKRGRHQVLGSPKGNNKLTKRKRKEHQKPATYG